MTTARRYLLISGILIGFLIALGFLSIRLTAQLQYHFALNHLRQGSPDRAIALLQKAVQHQPRDHEMWKALGQSYSALARKEPAQKAYALEMQARQSYQKSARLVPIDSEAHYLLAQTTARLEELHPLVHPESPEPPFNAGPHFQEALRLRPNGVLFHHAFARYLYRRGKIRPFLDTLQNLARIYPQSYSHLKKEPFWSDPAEEAVLGGLQQALEQDITPRDAHLALADILEGRGLARTALEHMRAALNRYPRDNTAWQYIRLGRLHLGLGEKEQASEAFTQALIKAEDQEKTVQQIFRTYQQRDALQSFLIFAEQARTRFPFSSQTELIVATALMDLGLEARARQMLYELNRARPTAKAYYLLARMEEKQENWDRMELAIQKATVLEPENEDHHLLFSRALQRQGKIPQAEQAATEAIEAADPPKHWLYSHRAWLRWSQK
ncbi:MAG: tetratricopeptide repeat protein, partial [Deltaproteobacteria bacterium]|nr:tetratricopeptide repeat protein [Deltaproteobacteria bacterium]